MDIITGKVIHYDIIEVCVHNHHLFSLFPLNNNNIQTFQKHKVNIIRSLFQTKNISFILDQTDIVHVHSFDSFNTSLIENHIVFRFISSSGGGPCFDIGPCGLWTLTIHFLSLSFLCFKKFWNFFFFFYWLWTEHRRVSQFNSLIEWKWMSPFDLFIHFLGQKVCLINFRLKVVVDDSIQHFLLRREYWLPLA